MAGRKRVPPRASPLQTAGIALALLVVAAVAGVRLPSADAASGGEPGPQPTCHPAHPASPPPDGPFPVCPSPQPSASPSVAPSETVSPGPSETPSPSASPSPTAEATASPSPSPSPAGGGGDGSGSGGGGSSDPVTGEPPPSSPAPTASPSAEPSVPSEPEPTPPAPPSPAETAAPPPAPAPTVGYDDETRGATRLSDDGRTGRNGPASVTVSNLRVVPGGDIELVGGGWLPGSVVNIFLFSTPVLLGTSTVDEQGSFSTTVRLPADTEPGAHTLVMTGLDENGLPRKVSIPINVVAAASSVTGVPDRNGADPRLLAARTGRVGPLAQTGGGAATLALRGVLLLLLGGLALRGSGARRPWLRGDAP
jgi:hypothetical protein